MAPQRPSRRSSDAFAFAARTTLAGAILAAAVLSRLAESGFPGAELLRPGNYDEGVYASAARMLTRGIVPYADYFFGHPPLGAALFAPAMVADPAPWGSASSFVDARYLAVVYSLIALMLVFGVGYLLAGFAGGARAR